MTASLLTPLQARAVLCAMNALNAVGGLLRVDLDNGDLVVQQHHASGKVSIIRYGMPSSRSKFESYADQVAFIRAYGLDKEEWETPALPADLLKGLVPESTPAR